MELPPFMRGSASPQIKTIEMHTTGEPTRIVYSGFPDLQGTLLEQRALAQAEHDHIRRALICEPRGHKEMYGAVLRPHTELTESGQAHMGVLFLTNEGYSTMCGHATLALGRLLVDYAGTKHHGMGALDSVTGILFNNDKKEARVYLHAPCGLVHVIVPIVQDSGGHWITDVTRPISYLSVPSYATAIQIPIDLPHEDQFIWPELRNLPSRYERITVDIAYGGAFYIIVPATSLGFEALQTADPKALSEATRKLKAAFNRPEAQNMRDKYLVHDEHRDLEFLYGVIVTDDNTGSDGAENGLCFFSNQQVDRSPTGSGVQSRVALAYAKKLRALHEPFTYHSPVSIASHGEGAFMGEAIEEVILSDNRSAVIVKVSGWARYTGICSFVVEDGDGIGQGFWFDELMGPGRAAA